MISPAFDSANARRMQSSPIVPIRCGFTLLESLVIFAILAIFIGLILSAVQRVRSTAQRVACANNLKQVSLALHNYQASQGRLPPGCSFQKGADAQPHMSWLTRLLPHLEHLSLWQASILAFEQNRFFESDPHLPILGRPISIYLCPVDDRSSAPWEYPKFQVAFTDYLGVEGTSLVSSDGVLYLDSRIALSDVKDGCANTLIVGERPPSLDHSLGWWYAGWGQLKSGSAEMVLGVREIRVYPRFWRCPRGPYHFDPPKPNDSCDAFQFWSFHPGGANFAFCDGSVRFFSYSADPIMPALATRAGGETVSLPE